jgi:hypothetical protein
MRSFILRSMSLFILVMGCATDQSEEVAQLKQEIADLEALTAQPPSSLDDLYPPRAEAPIYLLKMFEISTPLAGVAIDMSEEDLENARANFERFKFQYEEISGLVPEWGNAYPIEPVEELGKALEDGEQEKVMAAVEKVDEVCRDCHIANMVRVQQKYHWGDFSGLILSDPVTKEDVNFNQLMWHLERPFVGVLVDVEQGQVENALKHFETLSQRFEALRESCYACHETEREYFVDERVQALMAEVGATLKTASPDPKRVGELLQGIGAESCFKCHLVHLPAAYANTRWK